MHMHKRRHWARISHPQQILIVPNSTILLFIILIKHAAFFPKVAVRNIQLHHYLISDISSFSQRLTKIAIHYFLLDEPDAIHIYT